MNILYIDNEQCCLDHLQRLFSEMGREDTLELSLSADGLFTGKMPDILLLDIELDSEQDGLEIAKRVSEASPETRIIIVTAYAERYIQPLFADSVGVSGFLVKPVQREYLEKMLERAAAELSHRPRTVTIKPTLAQSVTLPEREIICIESSGHRLTIHTEKGEFSVYEKLESFLARLSGDFSQCHKSYAVNFSCIDTIEKDGIVLKNGQKIPASYSRREQFKESYMAWVKRRIMEGENG